MHIQTGDIQLNVEVTGDGPPLLLLHGFTGSAATWAPLTARLPRPRRTIAVDAIGHGRSSCPADPERYRMERCVEDLLRLLDALGVEQADVLGYSMGARTALHLCAAAPERIRRLVLESGSPGLATAEERTARIAADEALAAALGRDGVEAFVDRWESQPLFASQQRLPAAVWAAQRQQRLQNSALGLANSLRGCGTGSQESLWQRLSTISNPVLLIAGELDAKYCAIAGQMAAVLPCGRTAIIADAGHTVHLEQPECFYETILPFLDASQESPAPAGSKERA